MAKYSYHFLPSRCVHEQKQILVHFLPQEHREEARKLSLKYPDKASEINAMLSEVLSNWADLQRSTQHRRQALNQAYTLHKFEADLHELEIWVADTIKRMDESEPPTTISEAEALLELHQERKAEIDGRQDTFKALKEHGQKLVSIDEEVKGSLQHLEELRLKLVHAWEDRRQKLTQAHQLQLFKEQVDKKKKGITRENRLDRSSPYDRCVYFRPTKRTVGWQ